MKAEEIEKEAIKLLKELGIDERKFVQTTPKGETGMAIMLSSLMSDFTQSLLQQSQREVITNFINYFDSLNDRPKSPIISKDIDNYLESLTQKNNG